MYIFTILLYYYRLWTIHYTEELGYPRNWLRWLAARRHLDFYSHLLVVDPDQYVVPQCWVILLTIITTITMIMAIMIFMIVIVRVITIIIIIIIIKITIQAI